MSKPIRLPLFAHLPVLLLALASAGATHAQTAPAQPAPAESAPDKPSARIERITHEDALSRVDELRVGGQTRSIEVTPKNGAPAYEIAPAPGGANLSDNDTNQGSTGKSRWRIFNF
jgi:hypothetical protein